MKQLIARILIVLFGLVSLTQPGYTQEENPAVYEVDALHPSVSSPPDGFDLSNPRGVMRSFDEAIRQRNFEAAATALYLGSEVSNGSREEMARKLGEILDRQLWISGGRLSDRPDALIEGSGENPRVGQTQKSISLGTIELGKYPITIRLNRYKVTDKEPVWLFSEESVSAVPALYLKYGPGWIETRLSAWWRERSFLSVRRWEIAALPLLVLSASIIAWFINIFLGKIKRRVHTKWLANAVQNGQVPLSILGATIFGQTVINSALGFSGEITSFLTPILIAGIVIALVMSVLRFIDAGLDIVTRRYVGEIDDRLSRDDRQFYTSIYALRRVVTLIAFFAGAGLILWELGIFRNVGISLLASAGVVTVVLGIAAQTVLGNILASLQIAIAKPIRIGDSVNYEGQWAYVESIFYTFVRLRTWDDRRLMVPVQYFISHPFENWSMVDAKMTETFYLVLDHVADTDEVREQFEKIAKADDDVLNKEDTKMQVLKHDADGVHCRFYATAADPTTAWDMQARLREEMLKWVRQEHPDWWPRERVKSVGPNSAPNVDVDD